MVVILPWLKFYFSKSEDWGPEAIPEWVADSEAQKAESEWR